MKKENPWLPMYRPKIYSESTVIADFIESVRPKNEMTFLSDPNAILRTSPQKF